MQVYPIGIADVCSVSVESLGSLEKRRTAHFLAFAESMVVLAGNCFGVLVFENFGLLLLGLVVLVVKGAFFDLAA